jgi:hypothetical protein
MSQINKNLATNIYTKKREKFQSFVIGFEEKLESTLCELENLTNSINNNLSELRENGYNRDVDELYIELNEMVDKLWYNRHKCLEYSVENEGEVVCPDIWERALASAKEVEQKYGIENLQFDDFEWGMLNGKISALRWVLGSEWDDLDS